MPINGIEPLFIVDPRNSENIWPFGSIFRLKNQLSCSTPLKNPMNLWVIHAFASRPKLLGIELRERPRNADKNTVGP